MLLSLVSKKVLKPILRSRLPVSKITSLRPEPSNALIFKDLTLFGTVTDLSARQPLNTSVPTTLSELSSSKKTS